MNKKCYGYVETDREWVSVVATKQHTDTLKQRKKRAKSEETLMKRKTWTKGYTKYVLFFHVHVIFFTVFHLNGTKNYIQAFWSKTRDTEKKKILHGRWVLIYIFTDLGHTFFKRSFIPYFLCTFINVVFRFFCTIFGYVYILLLFWIWVITILDNNSIANVLVVYSRIWNRFADLVLYCCTFFASLVQW